MHRLGSLAGAEWLAHQHPAVFTRERTRTGKERLVSTNPGSRIRLFTGLLRELGDPVTLLYVLHTPRGEGAAGRYQSPWMRRDDAIALLVRFERFFESDGRFDLWVHSDEHDATLVWDRHDLVFGYGPLDRFEAVLQAAGFRTGVPTVPSPHEHHYHAECDEEAAAFLAATDWKMTPLAPSDEQMPA